MRIFIWLNLNLDLPHTNFYTEKQRYFIQSTHFMWLHSPTQPTHTTDFFLFFTFSSQVMETGREAYFLDLEIILSLGLCSKVCLILCGSFLEKKSDLTWNVICVGGCFYFCFDSDWLDNSKSEMDSFISLDISTLWRNEASFHWWLGHCNPMSSWGQVGNKIK